MGIHMAFHREPWNIAIHAFWSVMNAWAVLLIFYPLEIPGVSFYGLTLNGATLALLLAFSFYAFVDIPAALLTVSFYVLTYPLCGFLFIYFDGSWLLMVGAGIFLTFFSLAIQVYIGHGIAEEGIDDAFDNFKEFFVSRNPLYLALLPLYTFLDLMFRLGYRPKTARFVEEITAELRPLLEAERDEVRSGR